MGGLQDALGLTLGLRDDAVGVGFRLVLQALLIGARRLHVAEGVDHLSWRIDLLELHLGHQYAGAVAVEGLLHQSLSVGLGLGARLGEDRLDIALADNLAHGTFRHVFHRAFGVLDIEQKLGRVADLPEHDEIDVDDVLVAGQHQTLLRHVADRARSVADLGSAAHADLDAVDARHLGQLNLLDRIGPAEIQAGRELAHIFAEPEHDAELVGVNPNGEAEKADESDQHDGGQRQERTAHAPAGHRLPDAVLAAAQNLFEVGLLAGAAGTRAPGPAAAAFPAAASALIAPRHDCDFVLMSVRVARGPALEGELRRQV